MIQPTIGFITYGVHKDGLKDPMGVPFIDEAIVRRSKQALAAAGMKVIKHDVVLATKEEARSALKKMKSDDQVDMIEGRKAAGRGGGGRRPGGPGQRRCLGGR